MLKTLVTILALCIGLVSPVLADDYSSDYENTYTIASDLPFSYTSMADFGMMSVGSGIISNRLYNNLNSGFDTHTTNVTGRYRTITLATNTTAARTRALDGTIVTKLKWRGAPVNYSTIQRIAVTGLGSSVVIGTNYATGGVYQCVCFRADIAGSDVALSAVTKTNSAETVTSTGIVEALDVDHIYEIRATTSNVEFYIDGSLVATHTTTIPTVALVPIWGAYTKENQNKGVTLDWFKFEGPR